MLPFEIQQFSPVNSLRYGFQEIYDAISVANYTFYGIAEAPSPNALPDQTAAIWQITVFKNNPDGSPAGSYYYAWNQIWSNRASLPRP